MLSCRLASGPLWLGIYPFLWWFLLVIFVVFLLHWRYELPCQDKLPKFHCTPILGCIRVLWLVFHPLGLRFNKALCGWNSVTVKALGVSLNTAQRMLLQRDVCCIHTSSLKPTLTDENNVSRMELALSFIDKNDTSKFEHKEDLIHIDEKWFYLTKDGQCFINVADKTEPYWHVQHKSFLTKIMLLCAVARPRNDTNKNAWFDGKIGIWPIRKWELVKRSSKKRAKGMPVWKNQSITGNVYQEYLIQKLLPAMKQKWPTNNRRILLQQDGTKSHILDDGDRIPTKKSLV